LCARRSPPATWQWPSPGSEPLASAGAASRCPTRRPASSSWDEVDGSAEAIGSVNTIVNTGGQLRAYNTDYLADYQVPVDHAFAVLGSGGMARPWWRRCATPASTPGRWLPATPVPGRPWPSGTAIPGGRGWRQPAQLLVNATPVGMSGGPAADDLPVAPEVVDAAETVLDVVAAQALTPLVRRARAQASRSSPVPRSLRCRPWNSSSSTEASAPATTRSVAPQRSPARRPTPGAAVRAEHFHAVSSGPAGVSGSGDQGRSEFTVSPTVGGCRAGFGDLVLGGQIGGSRSGRRRLELLWSGKATGLGAAQSAGRPAG
jgi:hypothetical protein